MINKRKQLISIPNIQYKFIIFIFISLCIPSIIISFWCYSILHALVSHAESTEILRSALILGVRKITIVILIGFSLISSLLFYWSIIFSNRIVGPIYRLEKEIEEIIATNNFKRRLRFRKHDSFQSLAAQINHLLEALSSQSANQK
mgnify:CR=1 FL=1